MQAQYQLMENWMRRTNLKVNATKTEYMVYGSESHHRFFNMEGRLIRSSNKINYLGFQRTTKDGLNHIQKARIAGLTTTQSYSKSQTCQY